MIDSRGVIARVVPVCRWDLRHAIRTISSRHQGPHDLGRRQACRPILASHNATRIAELPDQSDGEGTVRLRANCSSGQESLHEHCLIILYLLYCCSIQSKISLLNKSSAFLDSFGQSSYLLDFPTGVKLRFFFFFLQEVKT